jgi:hypothetical protein
MAAIGKLAVVDLDGFVKVVIPQPQSRKKPFLSLFSDKKVTITFCV